MRSRVASRSGQVVVEMLLILPVFLAIVFGVMETGYILFRQIILNHATYEVARVGGMTWTAPGGGAVKATLLMQQILPQATVRCTAEKTLRDPQADQDNFDLVCTGQENVPLIFPLSSVFMAKPKGTGKRELFATVRMPIEQPLKK